MTERLIRVFKSVISYGGSDFDHTLRRDELDQWDSLAHLRLISAVETEFGCTFSMEEIQGIESFADLLRFIGKHERNSV